MISYTKLPRIAAGGKLTLSHFNAFQVNLDNFLAAKYPFVAYTPITFSSRMLITATHLQDIKYAMFWALLYLGIWNTDIDDGTMFYERQTFTSDVYNFWVTSLEAAIVKYNASDITVYAGENYAGEVTL
jgi:hypothetical protein